MIYSALIDNMKIDRKTNNKTGILVVDDMAINVMLLKRMLERANYQVFTAEDGIKALEVMQTEDIKLVLLDIRMPNLDGFGVLEKKSKLESIKNIPVIMTSAFVEQNVIDESYQKGANAYIKKPIDRKDLIFQMTRLLEETRMSFKN